MKRRIILGTYVLSAGYYDAYYAKAQKVRTLVAKDFEHAFTARKVDVILGPTTPTPAFPFGEKEDPLSMYMNDIYTVAINLAGLPGISIPGGLVPAGGGKELPFGIQLVLPWFQESKLFSIAKAIERLIGFPG
ncbi:MAG: Glutamyl-tRNA(Gln) amidotransferase subunit A [Parcubacteria group bacterium GW2011_GWB1_50_9]|nr:MAG: Glutamyl-tRNA(Gln) amidotransferase subunit A [Parcubacteria group bacterium GW2011_GWB1_50_9]